MQASDQTSGYWYADDEDSRRATAVLNSMRRYRASDAEMQRRTQTLMGLGETDLAAIRHLVQADREGRTVSPTEIAETLRITTASTTKLLDRLVRSGYAERRPHPSDRRGLVIVPTAEAEREVRSALVGMRERLSALTDALAPEQVLIITAFLARMTTAIEVEDQDREPDSGDTPPTAS